MFIFRRLCLDETLVPCSLAESGKVLLCTWAYVVIPFRWNFWKTAATGNRSQQTLCKSTTQTHSFSWTRACANSREIVFSVRCRLSFPSSRSCFFLTSAPLLNLGRGRCSVLPSGLSSIRSATFLWYNSNRKLLALSGMLPEKPFCRALSLITRCISRKQSISFNNKKIIPTLSFKMVAGFCSSDVIQTHCSSHFEHLNFL